MGNVQTPAQYFGGKSEFIDFYLEHTPREGIRTGVEVCAGMAAWTLAREPFPNDVINDRYEFIPDLFKAIRDTPRKLAAGLSATPYSLAEWNRAREGLERVAARRAASRAPQSKPSEVARMYLTVLRQSLATAPGRSWSRVIDHSRRAMCSSCSRFIDAPDHITQIADRLKTVQIECLDIIACIEKYDRKTTLFFIDPPYLPEVRGGGKANTYQLEMTRAQHKAMLIALIKCKGRVMLCGYASSLYDKNLTPARGWTRHTRDVHARTNVKTSGKKSARPKREEVLWVK